MKRKATVFIIMILLLIISACSKAGAGSDSQSTGSSTLSSVSSNSQLENKVTELERSRVEKHGLTLQDDAEAVETGDSILDQGNHTVSIEYRTTSKGELIASLEDIRKYMSEAEYQESLEFYQSLDEESLAPLTTELVLVDGKLETYPIPGEDYDGGEYSFVYSEINDKSKYVEQELTFATFEEYLEWIREDSMRNYGYSECKAELSVQRVRIAYEAKKSGNYMILPEGTIDSSDQSLYDTEEGEYADYRKTWEYDRDEVEKIKDSIDEINIYDEELDVEFLVHVTLPPDYDKDKTYPVFFLTDGVWRFGDHSELRKVMEEGEAADVILVSLGYNYHIDGTDERNRFLHLVWERALLLDFITDNLMPYLGENYKIDYANSTLYGHSDGGVFAHYALFNSDQYGNQPFGYYIIGSPAFWCLYGNNIELDPEGYETDYGYFDRNEKLDKHVFLCGGALEDPDYQDSYNGHATTLEGLENLKERLESHGSDVTCKLYDSHHYQFIPEMLIEYLKETYPKQ